MLERPCGATGDNCLSGQSLWTLPPLLLRCRRSVMWLVLCTRRTPAATAGASRWRSLLSCPVLFRFVPSRSLCARPRDVPRGSPTGPYPVRRARRPSTAYGGVSYGEALLCARRAALPQARRSGHTECVCAYQTGCASSVPRDAPRVVDGRVPALRRMHSLSLWRWAMPPHRPVPPSALLHCAAPSAAPRRSDGLRLGLCMPLPCRAVQFNLFVLRPVRCPAPCAALLTPEWCAAQWRSQLSCSLRTPDPSLPDATPAPRSLRTVQSRRLCHATRHRQRRITPCADGTRWRHRLDSPMPRSVRRAATPGMCCGCGCGWGV